MILTTPIAPQSSVTHSMPVGVDVHLNHSPMIRIWEDNGNGGETKIYEQYTSAASALLHVSSATWRIENFGWTEANIVIEQEAGGGSGGLAAGAATESAQDTGNASLASLDAKADNFATEATLQAQVSEAQASNTLLALIKTLLDAIKTLTQALLVKATPEIVTPIISQSDGTFPLNNAAQFGAFYDDLEGGTGTCNGVNVTHGYEISSPDNRHIAAGSFTLLSSNTGRWVTQETP